MSKVTVNSWYNDVYQANISLSRFCKTAVDKCSIKTMELFGIEKGTGKDGALTVGDLMGAIKKIWKVYHIEDGKKTLLVPIKKVGYYEVKELVYADSDFLAELTRCLENKSYKELMPRNCNADSFAELTEFGFEEKTPEKAKELKEREERRREEKKNARTDVKILTLLKREYNKFGADGYDATPLLNELKDLVAALVTEETEKASKKAKSNK